MAGAFVKEGRVDLHEEFEGVVDHSVDRSGKRKKGSVVSFDLLEERLDSLFALPRRVKSSEKQERSKERKEGRAHRFQ